MAKPMKQISNIAIKDYQRSIYVSTLDKDSSGAIMIEPSEKSSERCKHATQSFTKSVTTKTTAATTSATDYKGEMEKLKTKILECLTWKRIASITLTIFCCITIGLNLIIIIFFPIWLGTIGGFMVWVLIELLFGGVIVSFSSHDCKAKAPKQISKIKRIIIVYLTISGILLVLVSILMICHGFPYIVEQLKGIRWDNITQNMGGLFSMGELLFIVYSIVRILLMAVVVLLQKKLYVMCQKYNITEIVEFTKKHLDKI